AGNRVSLLPLNGDARGIHLRGFEYSLNDHTILSGSSLGISNRISEGQATVQFRQGTLLCIQTQKS
ncbi:MAG: thiamine diphosphokinase, partial [Desulforhopalus sp.]